MTTLASRFGRADRTAFGRWFWTVDRVLLLLVLLLVGVGLVAVAAASPAAAQRYSSDLMTLDDLHFLKRQIFWVLAGTPVLLGVSMLSVAQAKRAALAGTLVFTAMLVAVPFVGTEVNGAVRWLTFGGFQLQPSEFLKPCFVVATAWMLATRFEDPKVPAMQASLVALALVLALLAKQPDFGQASLFAAIWLTQAVIAGMSLTTLGAAIAAGTAGLVAAWAFVPHVTSRIDRFLTGEGDNYQVERALDCFRAGGLFGTGPGEGQMKFRLPEAQTDYIFSVIGEEFGAVMCLGVAALFLAFVARVLLQLVQRDDPFVVLAGAGLALQLGGQAAINMGVNLNLLPAKGMTLPFISHGGSSFLAVCLGVGLLLALLRGNPFARASSYDRQWKAADAPAPLAAFPMRRAA